MTANGSGGASGSGGDGGGDGGGHGWLADDEGAASQGQGGGTDGVAQPAAPLAEADGHDGDGDADSEPDGDKAAVLLNPIDEMRKEQKKNKNKAKGLHEGQTHT